MDRWNKAGVIFAAIATVVVVLQFFGLQPSESKMKGVHLETIIVAAMMAATWTAVYFSYRNRSPLRLLKNGHLDWRNPPQRQIANRHYLNDTVPLAGCGKSSISYEFDHLDSC